MKNYLVLLVIVISGLASGCCTREVGASVPTAKGMTASEIRTVLSSADRAVPARSAAEFRLSDSFMELLGGQYQTCLGQYLDRGGRIAEGLAYDDRHRQAYQAYLIFPQTGMIPEAILYLGCASVSESFYYWSDGSRFLSNDPAAKKLPGFHSAVREGQLRLKDCDRLLYPDSTFTYEYLGKTDLATLGLPFGQGLNRVFHYRVRSKAKNGTVVTDAYLEQDQDLSKPFYYCQAEDGTLEKRLTCTWTAPNGDNWLYAFCQPFSLLENAVVRKADLHMTVWKNGRPSETCSFPVDLGWIMWEGGIYIADFNFDGCPDLGIPLGSPANWGGRYTELYLREEKNGTAAYSFADSFADCPGPDPEKKLLFEFYRGSAVMHGSIAYEYRNGSFAEVASMEEEWIAEEDWEYLRYIITEENGNQETYMDELPPKWEKFWN